MYELVQVSFQRALFPFQPLHTLNKEIRKGFEIPLGLRGVIIVAELARNIALAAAVERILSHDYPSAGLLALGYLVTGTTENILIFTSRNKLDNLRDHPRLSKHLKD